MKTEVKVGIAVFVALVLLGGLVSVTGDVFWKNRAGYPLEVVFSDARGLGEGSFVFVSGVKAGKVIRLSLSPEGVHVILSIPNKIRIPRDSTFIIATGGLLGESEIHIQRGTSPEAFQPGEKTLGTLPPSFDQILSRVEEDLQELRSTFRHVNDVLESPGVKENLQQTFNDLPLLVADARDAATKLTAAAESFTAMAETGRAEIAQVGGSVRQATETLTLTLQENRLPLNQTMENLRSATSRLDAILADFDSDNDAGAELRETLSTVRRAARELEELLAETRQALSGEGKEAHPVSRFRNVVDKADRVLGRIEAIELNGQVAVHQVSSGSDGNSLMDLSFLIQERGKDWALEAGVEDLGDDEKFNAMLGWRWNDFLHFRGGIVRDYVGGGLKLDFRNGLGIPLDTSWLWWDDKGGQWKTDTFLEVERNWGIFYRHLHLDEENRDSLGLFYRF